MTAHRRGALLLVAAGGAVLLAVVTAVVLEPPGQVRERRLDERRVDDLASINAAVDEYWKRNKKLPESLDALSAGGLKVSVSDPASGRPYEYQIAGERSYRLCATFVHGSSHPARRSLSPHQAQWSHGSGRQCFERMARETPQ
jgi:hypothetical protein